MNRFILLATSSLVLFHSFGCGYCDSEPAFYDTTVRLNIRFARVQGADTVYLPNDQISTDSLTLQLRDRQLAVEWQRRYYGDSSTISTLFDTDQHQPFDSTCTLRAHVGGYVPVAVRMPIVQEAYRVSEGCNGASRIQGVSHLELPDNTSNWCFTNGVTAFDYTTNTSDTVFCADASNQQASTPYEYQTEGLTVFLQPE
jgi:hypothetical protein